AILRRVKEFTRPPDMATWEDVLVSELIYDAAAFCRTRVPSTARLSTRVETTESVRGIPSQLREVLVNLLNNAFDAISANGRVELAAFDRDGHVCISVSDDGPGIPEELREQIFEPFFTTKESQRGTGLGLSVSTEILRRHDVHLSLQSVPHERTCFELRFFSGSRRPQAPKVASRRVLVVDDDRAVGELIADVLKDAQYEVVEVRSSESAVAILGEESFGLMITDLDLDGDSGWELARAARRFQPELVIGLVTGWPIGVETEDVRERGVDFVLTKPFSPSALLETLDAINNGY
ncbi:MAG: ATP-binding protein, partial [Myxococcota bacterium]